MSWNFPLVVINEEDIDFTSIEKDFRRDNSPVGGFHDPGKQYVERNHLQSGNHAGENSLSSVFGYEEPRLISPRYHENPSEQAPSQAFEPIPFLQQGQVSEGQQLISDDEDDRPVEAFPDDESYIRHTAEVEYYPSRQTTTRLVTGPLLPTFSRNVTTLSNDGLNGTSSTVSETNNQEPRDVSEKEIEDVLSDNTLFMNFDFEPRKRFRDYQTEQWEKRYKELKQVYLETGRAAVHHADVSRKSLARWIKRQRAQYKLRQENKLSSMTDERIQALNGINFVWDSHSSAWEDRLMELEAFQAKHSHCNVTSSNHPNGGALVSWVKSQRRQYRLLTEGKKSNLTQRRIQQLESLGFEF